MNGLSQDLNLSFSKLNLKITKHDLNNFIYFKIDFAWLELKSNTHINLLTYRFIKMRMRFVACCFL